MTKLKPSDFAPLSSRVMIRHLAQATRKDAEDKARNMALDLFESPTNCWFYVQPFGDGFCIEVQEGVGRPYLPNLIEILTGNPMASVAVPMARRFLVAQVMASGSVTVEVLPEGIAAYAGSQFAERTEVRMTPVVATNIEWMLAGRMVTVSGVGLLLASIAWYALDPAVSPPPTWRTTEFAQLPVLQEERALSATGLDYLARMEFKDGRWTYQRKPDPMLAGLATPTVPAPTSAMPPPTPAGTAAVPAGLAGAAPSLPGAL